MSTSLCVIPARSNARDPERAAGDSVKSSHSLIVVWLVVSPFYFPHALTGGPMGAALVAGNTVVVKPATDTAWIVRLLIDCFRDAGFPGQPDPGASEGLLTLRAATVVATGGPAAVRTGELGWRCHAVAD